MTESVKAAPAPAPQAPQAPEAPEQEVVFENGIDLARLHEMLQAARERRSGKDVDDRISTLNLVAMYFSAPGYEKARAALEVAGTVHPARLVALIAEPKSPGNNVRGQVSVLRSGGSVALERIVLTATGAAVRHLQSAMLSLLVPELPVVFVWGGRPEGQLFEQALEKADRVIVDSGTRPLSAFLTLAHRIGYGAPVGDLAWARIFPWQSIAAEVLDQPNLREHRGRIQRARIIAAGDPGAEAALLAGWFASRVPRAKVELLEGPEPSAEEAAPSVEPSSGARNAVHAPPLAPGQIAAFEFDAPPTVFRFRRERGILVGEVRGDDDGEVVHRVRLPAETPGRLIGLELGLLSGQDELYAAAVLAAARLLAERRKENQ